jgi:hypothetical protein
VAAAHGEPLHGGEGRRPRGSPGCTGRAPGADAWYAEHRADIADKQVKYLAKWNARPAAEKTNQYLRPEDGV